MMKLENISKSFDGRKVLDNISLTVPEKGVLRLDGPSGCGKSTLLSIIAGIIPPDSGRLTGFENIRVAFAFQEDRLLPWFSALENVALVCGRDEAAEMLTSVGLSEDMHKKPAELSGGMRKRVNLARALCAASDLLLLDEPLQGLDKALRCKIILPLVKKKAEKNPVILVTHNIFPNEENLYTQFVYKML